MQVRFFFLFELYITLFKILTAEKNLLLLGNVIEKILDPKKNSSYDGALSELEKGEKPCNCRKLVEPEKKYIHFF